MSLVNTATGEIVESLTAMERSALVHAEAAIEQGAEKVARSLSEIRDQRLYREDYSTFETYCQERWGMTRQHVNRKIVAAEVAALLEPIGSKVTESQARELADLRDDPGTLRETYQKAHDATGGRVTAAAIREIREPVVPAAAPFNHAARADRAVSEFPDLAYYRELGDLEHCWRLADTLRGFDPDELETRLETLRRSIDVDRSKRAGTHVSPLPQTRTCPTCGQTVKD